MRVRPLERRISRFASEPVSIRNAMAVVVWVMVVIVALGGVTVWVFDRTDFPHLGLAMWWALQTVTTVGYGDIVPTTALGRIVGAVIMLESIAFVSIITALITSTFVERMRRERVAKGHTQSDQLAEIVRRLDRIEATLRRNSGPHTGPEIR